MPVAALEQVSAAATLLVALKSHRSALDRGRQRSRGCPPIVVLVTVFCSRRFVALSCRLAWRSARPRRVGGVVAERIVPARGARGRAASMKVRLRHRPYTAGTAIASAKGDERSTAAPAGDAEVPVQRGPGHAGDVHALVPEVGCAGGRRRPRGLAGRGIGGGGRMAVAPIQPVGVCRQRPQGIDCEAAVQAGGLTGKDEALASEVP
mmetsp:Transcript_33621/g.95078  ORF Transcript_33621/g.95078 Transcript_33621/m.95078 type:complete len:207 (+) Transcript_33621:1234-1854(+)